MKWCNHFKIKWEANKTSWSAVSQLSALHTGLKEAPRHKMTFMRFRMIIICKLCWHCFMKRPNFLHPPTACTYWGLFPESSSLLGKKQMWVRPPCPPVTSKGSAVMADMLTDFCEFSPATLPLPTLVPTVLIPLTPSDLWPADNAADVT